MRSLAVSLNAEVGVIGAGAMGAGIAQIAACAGHTVRLLDTRQGAADEAIHRILADLKKLESRGKIEVGTQERAAENLRSASGIEALADSGLVIEAIVEDLAIKKALYAELEAVVGDECVIASNTSSLSITSLGADAKAPGRFIGMHFFNPAPRMPLVEVIKGVATEEAVAEAVFATALAWGKTPVHSSSTPGFIVNRVARPFYAEALRLLQEGAADCATIDAVMRDCGGFRMGPFELMDLIGHDVNYAVTRSVFDAFYGDPRFSPSLTQLELVNAKFLGRKSGRGFYDYSADARATAPACEAPGESSGRFEIVNSHPFGCELARRLETADISYRSIAASHRDHRVAMVDGAALFSSDGRTATHRAHALGLNDVVLIDLMLDAATAQRAAISVSAQCSEAGRDAAVDLLQKAGFVVSRLRDTPGLAVTRTVAMLANEACDAVDQQVCSAEAVDIAMRGGVNYPAGPMQWAEQLGANTVLTVLDHLAQHYGETRYRASSLLRQTVWSRKSFYAAVS